MTMDGYVRASRNRNEGRGKVISLRPKRVREIADKDDVLLLGLV